MGSDGVSVVRTEVDGHESALRGLLLDYYEFADREARAYFDELTGIDIEAAVEDDIDRLESAAVDDPLFLARDGDRIVGSVQLKRLDETTAEVKRLYVTPDYRGTGIGQRLMAELLDGAERDGFETLRLGVGPSLDAARSLYEDLGFEYTSRYDQSGAPEAVGDEWGFMRRSLD
ncbi:GNAT family N-acetyltransferase [Halorussus aquaticus]|uniref:GNAT family N-acetyltransferase n=1 Tax=Halorussus aquaticus TaxID=2953748 RepID=A0ABD5Q0K2_9EURY|nr:GNAT family N-acetyltransferase [Halorussus aquaticus]